ncbi:hypothetical protein [Streptomyces sp. NPDC048489]
MSRVLIVEDDLDVRNAIQLALRHQGHHGIAAHDPFATSRA